MSEGLVRCRCSILDAREEKLLDDEGSVQIRLICNHCGTVLDSETARPRDVRVPRSSLEARAQLTFPRC